MCSYSPSRTPKLLAAEQPSIRECWIPLKKYTPCPWAKENPQQDGRRGEIAFRIKPQTHQSCLEGSNKTLCALGDSTESEPDLFECLSVSCGGTGQQWPDVGTGAWGARDLGMAVALLEAVAIYPTIEPPELTQDWGNRLLEGTNKTFCTPEPRDPTETVPELCLSVSCGGMGQQWPASGAAILGAADLGMAEAL